MIKTKKLPVSVSFGEYHTSADEFLVPSNGNDSKLIGMETGKEYRYGVISYIGVNISTVDIINKMRKNGLFIDSEKQYINKLENYIDQIKNVKISNIIKMQDQSNDNRIIIVGKKERKTKRKLP